MISIRCIALAGALMLSLLTRLASAQQQDPFNPPLAPLVQKLLDDEATSEAEKRKLAIFHGQWERITNPTATEQAQIALAKYDLDHASLHDASVPAFIRAQAALLRGQPEVTLKLLAEPANVQEKLLKAQAHDHLGQSREAIDLLLPVRELMQKQGVSDAPQLVAAGQAIIMLARLEGRPAQDYQLAMKLFAKARDEVDRLYWPASLAEAQLLIEKDNPEDALAAVTDVLRLNPRSADAALMIGEFAASRFAFDEAAKITARLREVQPDHLLASIIDATAYLTQKDAETARTVIEPALAKYPNHRELLALLASVEALTYNDAQLQRVLAHYDKLSGENPMALVTAGSYLAHARQYEASEKLLLQAVERQPNWALPRIELGLMLMQAGKESDALLQLRQAAKLDPFNKRARNQLKLVEELLGYEHIALDHFVIKYRKGIDEVLARDMERELEVMFQAVTGAFEHKPQRKTLIEIMPDEEWFGVRITGLPEIWTIAACTGDVIAMTPPREGKKQRGTYDWYRVLQHEYTHTVTLDQTAYRIPHWFTEAAAVSMEPGGRDYDMTQLLARAYATDDLFTLQTITWGFVRPRSPTDRPLAYAQAHWMFQYITQKFGHQAILDLLALYREGMPETKAITQVTGQEPAVFMTGFKAWAGTEVKSWGMAKRADDEAIIAKLKKVTKSDGAVVEALLKEHPDHPELLRLAASNAMIGLDLVKARTAVQRYAAARPADPWSHEALLELAVDGEQIDEAIASLNALDYIESSSSKWALKLAELYRKQGRFDQAARAIHRALHREPYTASLRELAAAILIQNKDLPTAAHHVRALTLLEPDRAVHQIRLAALYQLMGDKVKSRASAEAARKIDPSAAVDRFLQ